MRIRVVNEVGPGMVSLLIDEKIQVWVRSTRRGTGMRCIVGGEDLSGRVSYRPSGYPANRSWRICLDHMHEMIGDKLPKEVCVNQEKDDRVSE